MFGFACKACGNAGDKTTDTVKVNLPIGAGDKETKLILGLQKVNLPIDAGDKENAAPEPTADQSPKLAEAEEERQRQEQESDENRHRLEAMEQLRREQEEQRRQEEEERLRLQKLEAERQQRLLEERRAREAEELRRRQEEEARRRAEEAQKQEQLNQFLSKSGFASVDEKKKTKGLISSGFTYPLHAAVRAADAQVVALLLGAQADRSLKDSAKLTPYALAQKLDKKGSHKLVMDALSA